MLAFGLDGLDLLVGGAFGQDPVDTEGRSDRFRDVRVISRDHHHPLDARSPKGADHARRVGSDRIVDHERSRHLPVDTDEHGRGSIHHRAATHLAGPARQRPVSGDETGLAQRHLPAIDDAGDPRAVALLDVLGERQLQVPLPGGANDRRREYVRRHLVE